MAKACLGNLRYSTVMVIGPKHAEIQWLHIDGSEQAGVGGFLITGSAESPSILVTSASALPHPIPAFSRLPRCLTIRLSAPPSFRYALNVRNGVVDIRDHWPRIFQTGDGVPSCHHSRTESMRGSRHLYLWSLAESICLTGCLPTPSLSVYAM